MPTETKIIPSLRTKEKTKAFEMTVETIMQVNTKNGYKYKIFQVSSLILLVT